MSYCSRIRRGLAVPVVGLLALALPLATPALAQTAPAGTPLPVVDLGVSELDTLLDDGETTSVELVRQYLRRIAAFEEAYADQPGINAVITVNPGALQDAARLDAERAAGDDRGPLHGVPILLKDNFDTADLPTTAGSLPLATMQTAEDATQVARLRDAGAIIIAKANMHEFAGSWETVSSLGGQTRNPYDQTRFPGGSSGGTGAGVAASFAPVGMGSDTCGSIRVPAANNALVGLRATQGLTSQDGIFPMSKTQDVGGPMAKSVTDIAIVMDATAGSDPKDPATADADQHVPDSYLDSLSEDALQGKRIGLLTEYLGTEEAEQEVSALTLGAGSDLTRLGATVVSLPAQTSLMAAVDEASVLIDEMDRDTAAYFAKPGLELPAGLAELTEPFDAVTLSDAFATGLVSPDLEWMKAIFDVDPSQYQEHLAQRASAQQQLAALMDANDLDALLYPSLSRPAEKISVGYQSGVNCELSAHTGYPALTVPAGFTAGGIPVGVELLSRPYTEPDLLAMGFAYEQGTEHRVPPASTPELEVTSCDPWASAAFWPRAVAKPLSPASRSWASSTASATTPSVQAPGVFAGSWPRCSTAPCAQPPCPRSWTHRTPSPTTRARCTSRLPTHWPRSASCREWAAFWDSPPRS